MRRWIGAQKTKQLWWEKCLRRGSFAKPRQRLNSAAKRKCFQTFKFPIQLWSRNIPRSFLLQVTEKMISWCGEWGGSVFSFSSMLHQTRPAFWFLLSFSEGCTWKLNSLSFCLRLIRFEIMMLRFVAVGLLAMLAFVLADPTMYKRNEQNLYEPG